MNKLNSPEKDLKIWNMKYLNLCNRNQKKIRKSRNILEDNIVFSNNKEPSKILEKDVYKNKTTIQKLNNKIKEKDIIKQRHKYFLKSGIKNLSISISNNKNGSFISNNQTIISSYKTPKINSENGSKHTIIYTPRLDPKKIKLDNDALLRSSKHNFKKKKINLNFMKNTSIIDVIKYNQKIKGVNSSFSPKSSFYIENVLMKDISTKNILFKSSFFSDSTSLDSPKIQKCNRLNKKRNISNIKKLKFNNLIVPQKKIYQLIADRGLSGKIEKNNYYPEELTKMNIRSMLNLKNDNQKLFNRFYCIIERNKFKEEYQNPFTSPFDKKVCVIEKEKEEKKSNLNNDFFNINTNQLIKDMTIEINKTKKRGIFSNLNKKIKNNDNINKKLLYEYYIKIIINLSKHFKHLSISLLELLNDYNMVKICYTYTQTKELISAIKSKDLNECNKILDKYKYIVLDYDYYYLTPLHWAVKKNFYQIIPKLIEYGSILNFKNFIGDTPLHVAVKTNCYESVSLLLFYLASPFIKDKDGKKPIDNTNDFQMKLLLEKSMIYYYSSLFNKYSNQFEIIQKNLTIFFVNEFSMKLDQDIFEYIKEREAKFCKK